MYFKPDQSITEKKNLEQIWQIIYNIMVIFSMFGQIWHK